MKKSGATPQTNIRIPAALKREAKACAKWEGMDLSEYLRSALAERNKQSRLAQKKYAEMERLSLEELKQLLAVYAAQAEKRLKQ